MQRFLQSRLNSSKRALNAPIRRVSQHENNTKTHANVFQWFGMKKIKDLEWSDRSIKNICNKLKFIIQVSQA